MQQGYQIFLGYIKPGLDMANVMKARLGELSGYPSEELCLNKIVTNSYIASYEGEIKILDEFILKLLDIDTQAVHPDSREFRALDVPEFKIEDLKLYRGLTKEEAAVDKFWLGLTGGDQELLGEYVRNVFFELKGRVPEKGMAVYLPKAHFDFPTIYRLAVSSTYSGSLVYDIGLDHPARLESMAMEAEQNRH